MDLDYSSVGERRRGHDDCTARTHQTHRRNNDLWLRAHATRRYARYRGNVETNADTVLLCETLLELSIVRLEEDGDAG